MKKASNVLIKVGMILSFISGVLMMIYGLVIIIGGPALRESLVNSSYSGSSSSYGYAEMEYEILMAFYTFLGIYLLVAGVLLLVNGIICKNVRQNPSRSGYILCIVFGFLSMAIVNAVGGILGISALNQESQNSTYHQEQL